MSLAYAIRTVSMLPVMNVAVTQIAEDGTGLDIAQFYSEADAQLFMAVKRHGGAIPPGDWQRVCEWLAQKRAEGENLKPEIQPSGFIPHP